MKKIILLLSLLVSLTLSAYDDSDFDGVEDSLDRCPNTSFTDLVDISGCSVKSLVSPHHYDIIVGASYYSSDSRTLNATDTLSSSVQADYYYKNFSLQLSTSYFSTSGSGYSSTGFNDSFVGGSYQIQPINNFSIRVGAGAVLPTYDSSLKNNNTDYQASLNLSYTIDKINLFTGYSYTMINDTDTVIKIDANTSTPVNYQNTNAISAGLGYYATNKLYMSVAYNTSNSIYKGIEDIQTASLYGYYSFSEHWFSTFSYANGLSKSATKNYASARVGYYF